MGTTGFWQRAKCAKNGNKGIATFVLTCMPDPNENLEQNNKSESRADKAERHAEKGLRSDVKADDVEALVENKTKEARLLKELREDGIRTETHSLFGTPDIPGVIEGGAPSPATMKQKQLKELLEAADKGIKIGPGGKLQADGPSPLEAEKTHLVPAGSPIEIKGNRFDLGNLTAQDTSTKSDAQESPKTPKPTTAAEWKTELQTFNDTLAKKLGHPATQTDYAAIMLSQDSSKQEILDASLMYAFGIRDRDKTDIGKFAEGAAPNMIERAKNWEVFPEDPQSINPDLIQQNYPDCCPFMATVIGLAKTDEGKDKLASMIKPNADGTYDVYFPGDRANPVLVGGLTQGEKMLGSSSKQGYIFPAILEKAYGVRLNEQQAAGKRLPISSDASRLNFENYTEPMRLLTGDNVRTVPTRRSLNPDMLFGEDKLREELEKTKSSGAVVLAGIKAGPEDKALRDMDIHKNHAYLVVGFDDDGIELRDPLPGDDRSKKITWKQFNDNFNELIIQDKAEN